MDRQSLLFLLILAVAAFARLSVLVLRAGDLSTDPDAYLAHAEILEEGHGFASPATRKPTAFRPPGFPLLIALIPGSADAPERSVAIINFAAGILTVLLTKQLAEQLGLGPSAAKAAAVMTAVDPLLLRYTSLPMTEVLSALLLTGGLLLFVRYRQFGDARVLHRGARETGGSGSPHGRQLSGDGVDASGDSTSGGAAAAGLVTHGLLPYSGDNFARVWRNGAAAGLVLGLATLVRPVALVVAALLFGWLALRRLPWLLPGSAGVSRLRLSCRGGLFLTLAAIPWFTLPLTMSPWVIRNAVRFHHLIPATTHGGYTLALGNNPEYYRDVVNGGDSRAWDGVALARWQQRMKQLALEAGIPADDEVATDAWMYQQAWTAIGGDWYSFVRASLGRIRSFWALTPAVEAGIPGNLRLCVGLWYLLIWFGVSAAVFGVITGRTRICTAELWLAVLGFLLVHTFYWTDARMRAPLMPVLYVLSCIGGLAVCRELSFFKRKRGPAFSDVCRQGRGFRKPSETQEGHGQQTP